MNRMTADSLDYTPLEEALKQLGVALELCGEDPENELMRDGAIQRFEYSFELCMKFIKRALDVVYADTSTDALSFRDLLRTAAERQLIGDVERWFVYRDARNKTSHTYDSAIAESVFAVIPDFLPDAQALLSRFHAL